MYALDINFNENLFLGCYLDMVCIGAYTTCLDFSKAQTSPGASFRIRVCLKGKVSFTYDGTTHMGDAESCHSMTPLVDFLMRDVVEVQRIGTASLLIVFDRNGHLTLEGDESSGFESYTINIPGENIVVV
jgi:hypothetical protein